MTLSGADVKNINEMFNNVLIPLLVDDPLRENLFTFKHLPMKKVLIPLLVDDPLRDQLTDDQTRDAAS